MTKFTVEIDHDLSDKIAFDNLVDCRKNFMEDLGAGNSIFVWGEPEADDIEIQKHIDALDVIISWYGTPAQLEELYGKA